MNLKQAKDFLARANAKCEIEFGGVVPEDDNVILSQVYNNNKLDYHLPSHRAFLILSQNIETGSKKLYDCTHKYKGMIGGMRKFLKKKL